MTAQEVRGQLLTKKKLVLQMKREWYPLHYGTVYHWMAPSASTLCFTSKMLLPDCSPTSNPSTQQNLHTIFELADYQGAFLDIDFKTFQATSDTTNAEGEIIIYWF